MGNSIILISLLLCILFACNPPVEDGSMQPCDGYPLLTSKEEIKKTLEDRGVGDIEYANSCRQKYGWNMSPLEKEITDIIDCGFELQRITRKYEGYEDPYSMVFKKKN